MDAVAHWVADRSKSWGIDVTVWHQNSQSARKNESAASAPNADCFITRAAETSKYAKYLQLCNDRGIQLLPSAFNTYGGWGEVILKEVGHPHFNKLRDEEFEKCGHEWAALQKREFLFQAVSVAIAKGNSIILNTMDQEWRMAHRAKQMRGTPFAAKPDLSEKSEIAVSIAAGA